MEYSYSNDRKTNLRTNTRYSKVQDFAIMKKATNYLKILVIGEMGVGKSSLCSKLIGVRLMFREENDPESHYGDLKRVDKTFLRDHYRVDSSKESVTKETSFVLSKYLGKNTEDNVMIIDTPGFFDPQTDLQRRKDEPVCSNQNMVHDMTSKLKALGTLDGIVMLMRLEDRMSSHFVNSLKGILDMFSTNHRNRIMQNLAFCYSKCDESSHRKFRKKMRNREMERKSLVEELSKYQNEFRNALMPEIFFLTAVNETVGSIGQEKEFNSLLRYFKRSYSLGTAQITKPHFSSKNKFST